MEKEKQKTEITENNETQNTNKKLELLSNKEVNSLIKTKRFLEFWHLNTDKAMQ